MKIFIESGFDSGKWSGNLAKALRQASIIDDLVPRGRVWRPTWHQWIQYEPTAFLALSSGMVSLRYWQMMDICMLGIT